MTILHGTSFRDVLIGTSDDDTLYGYSGDDDLYGGDGNDHLWGGEGADHLDGGNGSDWAHYDDAKAGVYVRLDTGAGYAGAAAGDTLVNIENLSGSSYDDILVGDAGTNSINGNGGNDLILGLDGVDVLHGGNGDDHIWGGPGWDYIYGDAGFDFARYDFASSAVDVRLDEPHFRIGEDGGGWAGEALNDALWSIEGLVGSRFGDHLAGSAGANILVGLDGDDELFGKGGDDHLYGGEGADLIDGGPGFDYARYDDAGSSVYVSLETGWGYTGAALNDRLVNIEGLVGSGFDDTLIGDASTNVLLGGQGNDRLEGRAGDDFLYGGNGDDTLIGGEGADYLNGEAGFDFARYDAAASSVGVNLALGRGTFGEAYNDVLVSIEGVVGSSFADVLIGDGADNVLRGGAGADTLTGGFGNDQFLYERSDLLAERDVIRDFGTTPGDTDTLAFHGLAPSDIALTDVGGAVRVSVLDPSFGGDILVLGLTSAELSGHLLFA